MKKIALIVLALAIALSWGYCSYYSKVAENRINNYKQCIYSNGSNSVSMNVGAFEMCPFSIRYDSYNGTLCR